MKLLISLVLTCAAGVLPAAAVSSSQFGAFPTGRENSSEPWFKFNATGGTIVYDSITVKNSSARPQKFKLYGVDARAVEGGLAMANYGAVNGAGGWIFLEKAETTLSANSQENIKFEYRVPADAKPGVHYAGIIVEPIGSTTTSSGGINVITRLGVRLYHDVPTTGAQTVPQSEPSKPNYLILLLLGITSAMLAWLVHRKISTGAGGEN